MLRAQLDLKSLVLHETDSLNQRQVTDVQRPCSEQLRAMVTRLTSTGRPESFLAILLSAFSISPA